MTEPVVASVSEPVRPKRPTLYGVLYPTRGNLWTIGYASDSLSWVETMRAHHVGSMIVTVPGETDDATPATAKELVNKGSEPPTGPQSDRIVPVMCHGVRTNGWYVNDQYGWRAHWSKMDCEHNAPVTSWEELPEKPK